MRATVVVHMLDGEDAEAFGELAPLPDRVAFERRFGISATVLQRLGEMFDDDGNLKPGADPAELREEWMAFLAWRMLHRAGVVALEFEPWLENVAEVELRESKEEEDLALVPTETAAPLPTR